MKKTYQVPEIEVLNFVESTDLLTMSLYNEETSEPLSRETEMFFDDED
jgi:hypothetical protein